MFIINQYWQDTKLNDSIRDYHITAIKAHRLEAYTYHLDRLMAGTTKPGFVTYRWNKVKQAK